MIDKLARFSGSGRETPARAILLDRRGFLGALATAAAAPLAPRRVYSFLRDKPLGRLPQGAELALAGWYGALDGSAGLMVTAIGSVITKTYDELWAPP